LIDAPHPIEEWGIAAILDKLNKLNKLNKFLDHFWIN
jgi:hypothetical protein